MSNNKQSSVEWLYNKMYEHRGNITIEEYEQAKAMRKQELIDFHVGVMKLGLFKEQGISWEDDYLPVIKNIAEQFYNETFNNNEQQ